MILLYLQTCGIIPYNGSNFVKKLFFACVITYYIATMTFTMVPEEKDNTSFQKSFFNYLKGMVDFYSKCNKKCRDFKQNTTLIMEFADK